jgi:hypothetical protein
MPYHLSKIINAILHIQVISPFDFSALSGVQDLTAVPFGLQISADESHSHSPSGVRRRI